jgi:hypothetical protein
MRLLVLLYAHYRSTSKRTPHTDISNSVTKRTAENHDSGDAEEDTELPLCLLDANPLASGVSEFERGWAVNAMTKKSDDKRKKELGAKKAEYLDMTTHLSSTNIIKVSVTKVRKENGRVTGKMASKK